MPTLVSQCLTSLILKQTLISAKTLTSDPYKPGLLKTRQSVGFEMDNHSKGNIVQQGLFPKSFSSFTNLAAKQNVILNDTVLKRCLPKKINSFYNHKLMSFDIQTNFLPAACGMVIGRPTSFLLDLGPFTPKFSSYL